ncbi:MAG: hypothetical protein ACHQEB_02475 [Chitinophagales bacterium]
MSPFFLGYELLTHPLQFEQSVYAVVDKTPFDSFDYSLQPTFTALRSAGHLKNVLPGTAAE